MTITSTLHAIASVLQAPCTAPNLEFCGISTDSRSLKAGEVFLALRGDTFDGHRFLEAAIACGAVAVIVDQPVDQPYILVPDTLTAYQALAHWWRSHFSIPVIGITGSVGKTSTKEMLAAALSCYGTVLKSAANFNNDIGVPQTLLQLDASHDVVVLEMAMRGLGEIARLAAIAAPTHGIITRIGTAHIGRLGSQAAIAQAKCELIAALDTEQGVAILNGEDALMLETAAQVWTGQTLRYGLDFAAQSQDVKADWHDQTVTLNNETYPVPLAGRHQALNYLAVLATLQSLGHSWQPLRQGIQLTELGSGRNQVITTTDGITILDETYNAAPEAMEAALALLVSEPASAYWAVLGPMRELGEAAAAIYRQLGQYAATLPLTGLLLYDPEAELDGLGLPSSETFTTITALATALAERVNPGDRMLCKAARSIELERVIQEFLKLRDQPEDSAQA